MDTSASSQTSQPDSELRKPFLLERIIEASARNAFFIIILAVFGVAAGIWALKHTPLDAIPDLSDVQVIVYTDWEGRSPDLVEDQITYPISTKFIAAPKVKFVRGESMFGKSFVYVIFEDGTDIYWARSRVIEYLNSVRGMLARSRRWSLRRRSMQSFRIASVGKTVVCCTCKNLSGRLGSHARRPFLLARAPTPSH